MSTFSGLSTAASGLAAARRGMDVVGQNIANQNTVGYTRQRVMTQAVGAPALTGGFRTAPLAGQGVSITSIARLGDQVLDARVRDTLSVSGFWSTRALAASTAEAALAEPGASGLSARMSQFWAGWQDLANNPNSGAAAAVVIESGKELSAHLADGYRAVTTQWSQMRTTVDRTIAGINSTAAQVASLNHDIRDALASGRTANELIDQRSVLAQDLAAATGAIATLEADGTMTLRVDGNALVSGDHARQLQAGGGVSLEEGARVTVTWADAPDVLVAVGGGELGGMLSVLAPASEGGTLAGLAQSYNDVATALVGALNTQHRAGATAGGQPGGDFFALSPTGPAALGMTVAVASAADLALGAPGAGAHDATNADAISQLGRGTGSPDRLWSDRVSAFAVATASDRQRSQLADTTAITAASAQQSVAAVNGDEETISLVAYQAAYQAAARVITAVDEALDVVINRMGLVGR